MLVFAAGKDGGYTYDMSQDYGGDQYGSAGSIYSFKGKKLFTPGSNQQGRQEKQQYPREIPQDEIPDTFPEFQNLSHISRWKEVVEGPKDSKINQLGRKNQTR